VVLMLVGARARANGLAFLLGWVVGIAVVGTVVLLVAGPSAADDSGEPATWASLLKLVLGALLLLLAVRQWRGRPEGEEEVAAPKWMGAIDAFTPVKAAGAGIVLSSVNPKNLIFIVGAATALGQTGISASQQAVAWLVFTVVATLGVATPVVIYFALGDRAPALLRSLQTWMVHNNAAIMSVLFLVIGAKFVGDAIGGLST
jgi:threonine/homoserine/homoserine lactone efflux protein